MSIAIIPARGGSRRIPGKNIRAFHGRPIIAYSIIAALESGLFRRVYVSTDSQTISSVGRAYGAKIHNRAAALSVDEVGTQAVMKNAIAWYTKCGRNNNGTEPWAPPVHVCCIYPTAPMLRPDDLVKGFNLMRATDAYAIVPGWFYWGRAEWFGVKPLPEAPSVEVEPERYIDINTEDDFQRAERMYADLKERRVATEAQT